MSNDSEISAVQRTQSPYKMIGVIEAIWGNTGKRGTFAIVGQNDIITASHLVYDESLGGSATSIKLYLAADFNGSTSTFESLGTELQFSHFDIAYQDQIYTDSNDALLLNSESEYDLAIVGLDVKVGDVYGKLNLNPLISSLDRNNAYAVGYPNNGTGMMNKLVSVEYNNALWQSSQEDLKPGNSGGPLLVNDTVIGIASATRSTDSSWAGLENNFNFIIEHMKSNDSLLTNNQGSELTFDFSDAANDAAQQLTGFGVSETIRGGNGNDTLDGGVGNDSLYGDNGRDSIFGGLGNDHITGGMDNDTLIGNDGNDTLDGAQGADLMIGGNGNDTYLIDYTKDKIIETNTTNDNDSVISSISYVLGNYLENLTLNGNQKINGTGNQLNNLISGNTNQNKISAGKGNDSLDGGGGNDTLNGGAGNDLFVLHESDIITIQDFASGKDQIQLSLSEFNITDISQGTLPAKNFVTSAFNHSENNFIIYSKSTGTLYLHLNSAGVESDLKLAIIGNHSLVAANDIVITN